MEELTEDQKRIQKEIQRKVDLLKFFRTHVRLAGLVVGVAGVFAHAPLLVWVGLAIYVGSYTGSIGVMEDINILIWDRPDEQKNEEETKE